MMTASSAAWWLLPVLIALSAAAKLPREDFNQNEEVDLEMENGLVLRKFSPRDKRSADIDDIRFAFINHKEKGRIKIKLIIFSNNGYLFALKIMS